MHIVYVKVKVGGRETGRERERERECVCVCEREREREMPNAAQFQLNGAMLSMPVLTCCRSRNLDNGLLTNTHSLGHIVVSLTAQLLVSQTQLQSSDDQLDFYQSGSIRRNRSRKSK